MALTLVLTLLGPRAPAWALPDEMVTLNMQNVPISRVVDLFTQQQGLNIVASEAVTGNVTINLRDVPWQQALATVLKTKGLGYQQVGDVIYVDRLERLRPEIATKVFVTQHLEAAEVREMLQGVLTKEGKLHVLEQAGESNAEGGRFVVSDVPEALDRVAALLKEVDVQAAGESFNLTGPNSQGLYSVEIHNLPYSRVFEHLRRDFGVNILMDGPLDGRLEMSLADATRAELVDAILGSGPLRYSRDGTTYRVASREGFRERRVTRLFQLQFIDAADVKRFAESLLSPVGKIEVFNRRARSGFAFGPPTSTRRTTSAPTAQAERSDTVSVTDTSVVVDNIAALIARLDVRPRQVSIEVKMVEVTLQRNETLGINWNVKATMNGASQPTVLPFDSQSAGSSTVNNAFRFGTISAEDFQMVLQMLEKRNRLKVLSSPRISTLNNQEASILIGDKFPITVETVDPQTAVRTVTLDRYEQIGVQLQVVPQISGDSAVNLIIHPAVSSVGQLIQERFPVISTREADTQILVRNGDTAVIGGLLQERTDSIRTSVPGLGKVPFLGRLFQSDTNHTTTVDLLIFVTPHIVPDDSAVRDRPSQARRTVIAEEGKSAQRSRAGWSEPEPTSSRPMARKETASPVARVSRRARVAPDLGSYGFRGRARPGQRDAYKNTPVQEDESAPRDRARLAPAPSDRFERHLQELQSVLDSRDDSSWEDGSRVRAGGVER